MLCVRMVLKLLTHLLPELYFTGFLYYRLSDQCLFRKNLMLFAQSVIIFIINVIGCFISYEGSQPTMQCTHGWNIGQAPEGYYYYYNATTQGKWQLHL